MQARVRDIARITEELFPLQLAEKWDNVGLQIGSFQNPVSRVLVALDMDREVLDYAVHQQIEMIITHHPLFFTGFKSINYDETPGSLIRETVKAGITVYSVHTNLDAGERGLNQILAERIGLQDIEPLDKGYSEALYKLVVYVPAGREDMVRQAILAAGAGHIGLYKDCSFRVQGIGSFRPLAGSNPFIGQEGQLQEAEEYRLETIVPQALLEKVRQDMLRAHPYEEAAYDLYRLEKPERVYSLGRAGRLASEINLGQFCDDVKRRLGLEYLRVAGDVKKPVHKIAVVSGAGASFITKALSKGCDALLTGDLKYHEAREAIDAGIAVIDAGHQETERIMSGYLSSLLHDEAAKRGYAVEFISTDNRKCIVTI